MNKKVNIGIMGFGHIGRYIYENALKSESFEVKVISDIGNIESLQYLLNNNLRNKNIGVNINSNCFIYDNKKTQFIHGVSPGDVPWDALGVDWVIDATGKFLYREVLEKHIKTGAKKVILASLPNNELDNMIIPGINEIDARVNDKIISVGSSTTNAFAIMLKILNETNKIKSSTITTVHSYTSDQPLLDTANVDLKRSRSAAKNIIPNINSSSKWIEKILPEFKDRIFSTALNVPVQFGSLLDMTTVFENDFNSVDVINDIVKEESKKMPNLIKYVTDPIVSSDVVGMSQSVVFDSFGTLKVGENMVKTLSWYDNGYNHATRILDVIKLYEGLKS